MKQYKKLNKRMGMKKLSFSIAIINLLSLFQIANAQINLEHTFNGYVTANYSNVFPPEIEYYVENMSFITTNQVRIYNKSDYSLYRSVSITPPSNYTISQTYFFSKNVFTLDNKLTFFVFLSNVNDPDYNLRYGLKLYNEDGVVVKDFGFSASSYSPALHLGSDNSYRLLFHRYLYVPLRHIKQSSHGS